jgi:hypothetical protein
MVKIGSIILLLSVYHGFGQTNQEDKGAKRFGSACSGGGLWYDDGTYEDLYTYPISMVDQTWVQRFAPPELPYQIHEVCVGLVSSGFEDDLTGTIVLFADSGSGPGALLYEIPFTAIDIPIWPGEIYSYDISGSNAVVSGSFYLGVRWTALMGDDWFYVLGDESITTPLNPGYWQYSGHPWQAITADYPGYRALGVRLAGSAPVDVPALGPWGLLGLVAVLMVGGLFLLRRRQQAT